MIQMMRCLAVGAATVLVAGTAAAQQADEQLAEIDTPASELNEILLEQAEVPEDAVVRVVRGRIDPNTAAAWHTHPSPVYIYVEEGTLSLEIEGQEPYDIATGEAVAEPLDARMRAVNRGDEPVEIVVFQVSPAEREFLEQDGGQAAETPDPSQQTQD